MEALNLLEQKITSLVEFGKQLKEENSLLKKKVQELEKNLHQAEKALLADREFIHQEQEVAQLVLADLIKGIDSVIEGSY
jgi:predicted  nucleic acid-binding Zn-ribbon protein